MAMTLELFAFVALIGFMTLIAIMATILFALDGLAVEEDDPVATTIRLPVIDIDEHKQ